MNSVTLQGDDSSKISIVDKIYDNNGKEIYNDHKRREEQIREM